MTFDGKVAIVTGASEGIGFAVATALVAGGARVVMTARRESVLAAAAERLGPLASWVVGDAADPDTAQRAVDRAVAAHGGVDLLVCNAAALIPGGIARQPMAEVDRILAVNLRGTIALMNAAVPELARRDGAAAVVISSSMGRKPAAGLGIYGATKAALHYLVPTWATELAPLDIRVNCVCAGITDTPGLRAGAELIPGLEKIMIGTNLVKRIATAAEIARPVLTLLDSTVSGYVTGSIWDIDGGYQLDSAGSDSRDAA
ncbi:MAG TPA: SDR family oxidoreductase [Mycobacteriales bacterium]|nr:SDR family oxidoreductase [Mycobacteriales bacterium]